MTKSRNILKPRAVWTQEQEAIVLARYPHEKTEKIAADIGQTIEVTYRKAKSLGLKKTPEYLASPDACRLRRENSPGVAHRFPKGHVPANKGSKGVRHAGTEQTWFKPGEKSHTWMPIGSERMSKEGYLQVKLHDSGVTRRDFVPVHHLVWELHRGAIPEGHRIAFIDGDKTRITIENLEVVSSAEMMRRNTIHNYPKEVVQLVQLRGVLTRKINKKEKRNDKATRRSSDQ